MYTGAVCIGEKYYFEQGCIKFRNSRQELTGIKALNCNFEGKIKLFLSRFSIFSPFFTDFSQSEGKINCFSVKTSHYII